MNTKCTVHTRARIVHGWRCKLVCRRWQTASPTQFKKSHSARSQNFVGFKFRATDANFAPNDRTPEDHFLRDWRSLTRAAARPSRDDSRVRVSSLRDGVKQHFPKIFWCQIRCTQSRVRHLLDGEISFPSRRNLLGLTPEKWPPQKPQRSQRGGDMTGGTTIDRTPQLCFADHEQTFHLRAGVGIAVPGSTRFHVRQFRRLQRRVSHKWFSARTTRGRWSQTSDVPERDVKATIRSG